ncbi:hypothetical protein [Lactobacillus psittaci]|nr:hypothetical protein [Lactobacillus psittaci]
MEEISKILDQLINGEIKEYRVEAENAFEFQKVLRTYAKRQNITGRALRGGAIIYHLKNEKI